MSSKIQPAHRLTQIQHGINKEGDSPGFRGKLFKASILIVTTAIGFYGIVKCPDLPYVLGPRHSSSG
jgi:hypothetical protein